MGNLVKSIKNVGRAMNGIEPIGKVVTEVLRSLGATATGQAINGHTIADIINDFADKLSAEPIEEPANGLTAYGKIVNAIKRLGIAMNGEEPDGKLISKVLKNLGEDATKTTINGYAIADILNDIADKWIHLSLSVQPVAGNVTEFGKLVSDLQSNIVIGSNAITGTLHYVTGYTGFSGDPAEQSGHYIALKATASEPATITAQVIGGTHGAVTLESDGGIVCRIANNEQSIRFIAKAQEETFTVDLALTNLVLANSISASVTNGTASGAVEIAPNGTATVTLSANEHYNLPSEITVVGATYTYDSATGVVALSNPTGNVTITAVCESAIDPVFGNNSWANIRNAVRSGNVPNTWAVGDTKSVTLTNNTTMTVRIADMTTGRYDFADNSGNKSNMVIEFVECFSDGASMNSLQTNSGGWASCEMRSTTMSTCLALLPQDMQNAISEVLVLSGTGGIATGTSSSANKLFLPCEYEIFGVQTNSIGSSEGMPRFEYYTAHPADCVKQRNGSNTTWWLRSPRSENYAYFCSVRYNGVINSNSADTATYSVAPVFAI